jgi:signal transduction histidine kinase
MKNSLCGQQDYLDGSIKTAQYLAGLTTQQDIWSETGKLLVSFFGADLCCIGEQLEDGEIVAHHWVFSKPFSVSGDLDREVKNAIAEVLGSGYFTSRTLSAPEPVSIVFLPIIQENRVVAVMVAGHLSSENLPKNLLNVYLAVSGLVGSTAARLATEQELRRHRHHLQLLVRERTADLTIANEQLRLEIAERQHAESKRLELERRLLHAQKLESLGVLAGGIAHDFNNLLAVIIGDLDLALMKLPDDSPVRDRIVEALLASDRAANLIRQMLAYAGKGHFILKDLNLNDIVRENANLFRTSVSRNIELNINPAPGLPVINADHGQVQQVIMNLMINASEAIGTSPGVISLCTGVLECDDQYLSASRVDEKPPVGTFAFLEVSDTGSGMNNETQLRLFDPFFTTKFAGRGLGMSAVLGIVRAHKGAILLKSEVGHGATFRILFPVNTEETGPVYETTMPAARSLIPRPLNCTVLVVDDEDLVREMCIAFIRSLGFQAIGAADGYEALRLFREHANEITLVILDMTMPRMDGASTFYELRKIRPDVRVIISSGYSEENVTSQFTEVVPAGFIHKPFRTEILQSKIEQVMNRKE